MIDSEYERTDEAVEEQNQFQITKVEKKPFLHRLLPYLLVVLSFFTGIFLFFPNEKFGKLILRGISSGGLLVSASNASVSLLGSFEFENLTIPITSQSGSSELRIPLVEGNLSPFALLFSQRLSSNIILSGVTFKSGAFVVRGGNWEINMDLNAVNKNLQNIFGTLKLNGSAMIIEYNEDVPFLNEKIKMPVQTVEISGKMGQGRLLLQKSIVNAPQFNIQMSGDIGLARQAAMNINIEMLPKPELFQKYQDKGLEEMLKALNFIHPDQRLRFEVNGSLSSPAFKAVPAKIPGT